MSKFAKISFNGKFLINFPIEKLHLINSGIFKYYYNDVLARAIQDRVAVCFSEMLRTASRKTKPNGEDKQLIEALKEAIQFKEQLYIDGKIGILSIDVLDKLLMIKKGSRSGVGWWRVLESKQDNIVNNNYMFIPKRGKGKFKEGFLVERSKISSIEMFRPHSYSVKDKRYVTKFINNLTKETIDNENFMDRIMLLAVSKMLYNLNLYSGVPSNE